MEETRLNDTAPDDNVVSNDRPSNVLSRLNNISYGLCSSKVVKNRLPIVTWLPSYNWAFLLQDILAGFTVGLTAIPQGIAYAVVAGLKPQYGLYASFMGSFAYVVFGSCKDVTIGPTAILALMVQSYVVKLSADYAILVTFLSGCIILILGMLHLGFLVQFISMPVTVGFTGGAALTIMASQLKALFGAAGSSTNFLTAIINLFKNIHTIKLWDSLLGISTIALLLLLKYLGNYGARTSNPDISPARNCLKKFTWLICLGRNAIVVIFGCVLAWSLKTSKDIEPFALTGEIQEGLPSFSPPPFSTTVGNQTQNFSYMVSELGTTLITLPLIAILETIAIAKAFSKGKIVDATQEMIALGLCNIFGSFFLSMPTTGSFTRTAVNNASGVQTPAGGIFTGILVLLALGLLTKAFYFIPKATLAGLIVCAMFFMIEFKVAVTLWKTSKTELLILFLTLFACLVFSLEVGICVGVLFDAAVQMHKISQPEITSQYFNIDDVNVLLITMPRSIAYSAADYMTRYILGKTAFYPDAVVVINGKNMNYMDMTVAKSFKSVLDGIQARKQQVVLWSFTSQGRENLINSIPKVQSKMSTENTIEDLIKGFAFTQTVISES